MVFCHPYDDVEVVAGQATLGSRTDRRRGGSAARHRSTRRWWPGGGIAIAVKTHDPSIEVIGVQVSACAPYAHHDPPTGPVVTLADGIAVKRPGEITRPLVEHWLDEVVVVEENAVADAMVLLMERAKLFVEGAGAVGVAALLSHRISPAPTGTTCVVLSGGNVDLGVLPGLVRRHETQAGRRLIMFVRISDRPGALACLLTLFADHGANLIEVDHVREGVDLHVRQTGVKSSSRCAGRAHAESVIHAASEAGYEIINRADVSGSW